MTNARIIEILDPQAGHIRETEVSPTPIRLEYDAVGQMIRKVHRTQAERGGSLLEAFVLTPDAGNLLRDNIRLLGFTQYQNQMRTYAPFINEIPSNRPQEEWLRDAAMGVLPRVPSGAEVPMLMSGFEGGITIANYRYAGGVEITGDDIRFDRLGKIRQIAPELGLSAAMTEEKAVYDVLTNANNYVRNSTTNDNDIGANTAATAFTPSGIETAVSTVATAKDRKSRAYLGMMPDTFICGPRLSFAATQLFTANEVQRVGGNTTNDIYGTGTANPFKGIFKRIIVSPWFGASYQWAVMDSTRTSVVFQRVEPFNILQEAQDASSESWLTREVTRYIVSGYIGVGMADDRAIYYSSSTAAPAAS